MEILAAIQTELHKINVSVVALQQHCGDMNTEIERLERQVKSLVISFVSDSFGSSAPIYYSSFMTPDSLLKEVQADSAEKLCCIDRMIFESDCDIARWWGVSKPTGTD